MDNKVVTIDFDGLKRTLQIPFAICCSREALRSIVDQLSAHLEDPAWTYGWTHVHLSNPVAPNTKPIGWHERS